MKLFIVIFEITRITPPEQEMFHRMMSTFGEYYQLTKDSYLLHSDMNPIIIRDILRNIRSDARIFVSAISTPAAWGQLISKNSEVKYLFSRSHDNR